MPSKHFQAAAAYPSPDRLRGKTTHPWHWGQLSRFGWVQSPCPRESQNRRSHCAVQLSFGKAMTTQCVHTVWELTICKGTLPYRFSNGTTSRAYPKRKPKQRIALLSHPTAPYSAQQFLSLSLIMCRFQSYGCRLWSPQKVQRLLHWPSGQTKWPYTGPRKSVCVGGTVCGQLCYASAVGEGCVRLIFATAMSSSIGCATSPSDDCKYLRTLSRST